MTDFFLMMYARLQVHIKICLHPITTDELLYAYGVSIDINYIYTVVEPILDTSII